LTRGAKRPDDVFVVRSGPAPDRFVPAPPAEELKRGKPHLLAYLGVMGPQDGVDYALRALAQLRDRRDDWHAIFVGSGDVFEEMTALAAELGLDGNVEFTGRVSNAELVRILSTADIGLAPDPKNPLNDVSTMNKIVEYMAMGLPVVSFDLREARVSAADAALYARPNDESDFAAQIASLLDQPDRREQMAELGRRRANGELSWEFSTRQLLRAYSRALELRAGGRSRLSQEVST
jgi:glycosyltransferase involved in cell wall biosynthesis